jgi:hypothetical protein
MKPAGKSFGWWTVLGALFAVALTEMVWLHRLQSTLRDVTGAPGRITAETNAASQADLEVEEQIRLAEGELAQLPRQIPAASDSEKTAIEAWLARVKRLQAQFKSDPAIGIPEMRLLTESDWLKVAASASFDSDEGLRRAEGAIRDRAKWTFSQSLASALDKFTAATRGELPLAVLELEGYAVPPLDPSMLARYEMARSGNISDRSGGFIAINEISPVDPQFDSRIRIQTQGGASATEPPAWNGHQ